MDTDIFNKLEELRKKRESSNKFNYSDNNVMNNISHEDDSLSDGMVDIGNGNEKVLLEKPKTNSDNKKIIKENNSKKEITKEMIFKYMASKGTKNSKIQDIIYEQAMGKVGNNPKKIAKVIVEFYKR